MDESTCSTNILFKFTLQVNPFAHQVNYSASNTCLDGLARLGADYVPAKEDFRVLEDVPSMKHVMYRWFLKFTLKKGNGRWTEQKRQIFIVLPWWFTCSNTTSSIHLMFRLADFDSLNHPLVDENVRHRVALGKPCTAIHWGAWGEAELPFQVSHLGACESHATLAGGHGRHHGWRHAEPSDDGVIQPRFTGFPDKFHKFQ